MSLLPNRFSVDFCDPIPLRIKGMDDYDPLIRPGEKLPEKIKESAKSHPLSHNKEIIQRPDGKLETNIEKNKTAKIVETTCPVETKKTARALVDIPDIGVRKGKTYRYFPISTTQLIVMSDGDSNFARAYDFLLEPVKE